MKGLVVIDEDANQVRKNSTPLMGHAQRVYEGVVLRGGHPPFPDKARVKSAVEAVYLPVVGAWIGSVD
jgi:hypothetical protein